MNERVALRDRARQLRIRANAWVIGAAGLAGLIVAQQLAFWLGAEWLQAILRNVAIVVFSGAALGWIIWRVLRRRQASRSGTRAFVEHLALATDGLQRGVDVRDLRGLVRFCRSIRRVERIETEPPRFIRATVLPAQSDLDYGRSEWFLEAEKGNTRLTYRMAMHPSFAVPPVLGPWLLRRSLLNDGAAAVDRIEEVANALPAPQ